MPPKAPIKTPAKVIYPPGVKEITDDLGTDELVRRLKTCAQAFQNMGQDDNNGDYVPLAMQLAQDYFLDHSSKDVRLLIACCIADVFRVYAPDAPYKSPDHLKNIFLFLIKQLRGLQDPKEAAFKRYFYLLENLAWVKSFNICIELDDNQEIFCRLFTLMFTIVNDNHSTKVKNFMLDMMVPLISEADSMSQELLDVILSNIIEPRKSQNRNAYNLARDLLRRTSATIEPYIQSFFNNALILGKSSESEVAPHLYDLIYELNSISPSVLLAVLPQLEFKLKSNDEKERLEVTRLLARMFSDKNSELATQHKALWTCFLGRFNDIGVSVRIRCVQYSMHFLLNHPELRTDITEQLKLRQHDPEETVRYEVVMAIISAAKKDFTSISDELLNFVKERTLDKKFKIRKEALLGLSMIYKKCMTTPEIPDSTRECVSWIKNKVLHVYYQTALEDRLLVERILHTCLVPYQLPSNEKIKKLYQLYATVDDHAVKAFNELLKCQNQVRHHARTLLELHKEEKNEEREKQMHQKIVVLAKSLPEPVKAQEFLKKFNIVLQNEPRIKSFMETLLQYDCNCKAAENSVREILKKLGNPVMTNIFYMTVKQLLERIAPVLIDHHAVLHLINLVEQALENDEAFCDEIGSTNAAERGLKLLLTLASVFPGSFQREVILDKLTEFLQLNNELAAEITLQILVFVVGGVEEKFPIVTSNLLPLLREFASTGTVKQAKHAIKCIHALVAKSEEVFGIILENIKIYLTLESPHYRTALVTIGHISFFCPEEFFNQVKSIVSKNVVKDLLMQNREGVDDAGQEWCSEEELTTEAKAKLEGMKLMVRWLLGLKNSPNFATSTLRLLTSVVDHHGDLMRKGNTSPAELAWLRLMAGCCIMKIAQEQQYAEIITLSQFQTLALLLRDKCDPVRERFAQKLHKGLISLKLPLDYMAMFSLGAAEVNRELKSHLKQYLLANINKRKDYIKQHALTNDKLALYLPDYVVPYTIHFLAHHPDYKKFDDVKMLQQLKDAMWFILEPLMTKSENYSFSFFKRLVESIKQTKDAQNPDDEMQNMKLYAVCDLSIGIAMSKATTFVVKEFPMEPILPKRLFTDVDANFLNMKYYLPAELAVISPKRTDLDTPQKEASKTTKRGRFRGANGTRGRGRPSKDDDETAAKKRKTTVEEDENANKDDSEMNFDFDKVAEVEVYTEKEPAPSPKPKTSGRGRRPKAKPGQVAVAQEDDETDAAIRTIETPVPEVDIAAAEEVTTTPGPAVVTPEDMEVVEAPERDSAEVEIEAAPEVQVEAAEEEVEEEADDTADITDDPKLDTDDAKKDTDKSKKDEEGTKATRIVGGNTRMATRRTATAPVEEKKRAAEESLSPAKKRKSPLSVPVPDKNVKTTRSTPAQKSKEPEKEEDKSETPQATTSQRISVRQVAPRGPLTRRTKEALTIPEEKEPKDKDKEKQKEKAKEKDKEKGKEKDKEKDKSTAPPPTSPTRRNLRRTPSVTNGMEANDAEDVQESSDNATSSGSSPQRKSSRLRAKTKDDKEAEDSPGPNTKKRPGRGRAR